MSKAQQKAAYKLAPLLSQIIGLYVDPLDIKLYSAIGYWSHVHQDCQKFTGNFTCECYNYSIGSWDLTLSDVSRKKFKIYDNRKERNSYSDFEISH